LCFLFNRYVDIIKILKQQYGENDMDEDGGSPHLFISKALIKNWFVKRSPETASDKKLLRFL